MVTTKETLEGVSMLIFREICKLRDIIRKKNPKMGSKELQYMLEKLIIGEDVDNEENEFLQMKGIKETQEIIEFLAKIKILTNQYLKNLIKKSLFQMKEREKRKQKNSCR